MFIITIIMQEHVIIKYRIFKTRSGFLLSGYRWDDCPIEIKLQITNISDFLNHALGENLIGTYLHGSLCLGSFQPSHSDLDMIVITKQPLTAPQRLHLMNGFLALHKKPSPIEISILCYSDLNPWRHPTPYEFHFSEYWRPKFEVISSENDLAFWDIKEVYTDGDIACHVTLINQSGICIYGRAISEIFPVVPEKDFWDSIFWGIEYFSKLDGELLTTGILTLLRIWSYKENKAIYSKAQAGEWAVGLVPSEYRDIIENLVDVYNDKAKKKDFSEADLNNLRHYVINQIKEIG